MGDFTMPSLGADMTEGTFIEWLVSPGDAVHRGDVIAVVETPKSAVEVETFEDGTVEELLAQPGDLLPVGGVLARIRSAPVPPSPAPPRTPPSPSPPQTLPSVSAPASPPASPLVRHRAAELGIDLATIVGSGRDGAVTRSDLEHAVALRQGTPTPAAAHLREAAERQRVSPYARRLARELGVDVGAVPGTAANGSVRAADVLLASEAGVAAYPGRRVEQEDREPAPPSPAPASPPSPAAATAPPAPPGAPPGAQDSMRQSIAALMTVSNREVPHYYLTTTVDLAAVTDWVRRTNRDLPVEERLVPSALLLLAAARAARAVPELNGHWVDGRFRPAERVDLGLILSLRRGGLLVPAIAAADTLTVPAMMAALRALTTRARTGRLRGSDLGEPSITVSNLGDQGVESVLGVIYPPQVALVGFGAVSERPWAVDGLLGVRPLVTVTLAGDHRASDGAVGARFLKHVDRLLQKPEEL